MDLFTKTFLLFFVLLNPFSMSVYLLALVKRFDFAQFSKQLIWAAFISLLVFFLFAWAGDSIFEEVLQIRFASFQIFGGITFLIIGIRLILGGAPPVDTVQPQGSHLSGSIAMPFIVGPGTIGASVFAGTRLEPMLAFLCIASALSLAVVAILAFKLIHDYVVVRNEKILHRYTDIAGRVTALFTGSFAVELIVRGIETWVKLLNAVG